MKKGKKSPRRLKPHAAAKAFRKRRGPLQGRHKLSVVKHGDPIKLVKLGRQEVIMDRLLEGRTQQEIGDELGVNKSTVNRLIKDLYEQRTADIEEMLPHARAMELERINRMMLHWYIRASKEERASEVYFKYMAQRQKLLGLEISKTELSGRGGGPIEFASQLDITKLSEKELGWLMIIVEKAGPKVVGMDEEVPALEHKPKRKKQVDEDEDDGD